jgi:hypothetical protein
VPGHVVIIGRNGVGVDLLRGEYRHWFCHFARRVELWGEGVLWQRVRRWKHHRFVCVYRGPCAGLRRFSFRTSNMSFNNRSDRRQLWITTLPATPTKYCTGIQISIALIPIEGGLHPQPNSCVIQMPARSFSAQALQQHSSIIDGPSERPS